MNNELKNRIASLPDSPGVYSMKDKKDEIIYIGKANSLRKRLSSYLSRDLSAKTIQMMANVADIEYQLCPTESMALLLEASLIRQYKPKYNVALRDDKSFPLVKITHEEFSAVYITRKKMTNGARYFGPYLNAGLLREALKIIRKNFPYRSCKTLPKKACVYYRIKLSPAPCIGKITKAQYSRTIKQISLILEGKTEKLIKGLTQEMKLKSRQQRFEEAAILRDKIITLSSFKPEFYTPQAALSQVKEILALPNLPRRIEAFDVSNIFGRQASASMVSFYNGLADKANYRRFRIKTVDQANDYQMLAEAVSRRYRRVREENLPLPDLILVDGGKGQLWAAKKELEHSGFNIPVISLSKKEELVHTCLRQAKRGRQALVSSTPLRLKTNSAALRLLQHIRNESHRFALAYHRILRKRHAFGKEK